MKLDPLNFQTKCSFRVKTRENLAAFEKRSRSQGSNSGGMFLVLEEVLKIWISNSFSGKKSALCLFFSIDFLFFNFPSFYEHMFFSKCFPGGFLCSPILQKLI